MRHQQQRSSQQQPANDQSSWAAKHSAAPRRLHSAALRDARATTEMRSTREKSVFHEGKRLLTGATRSTIRAAGTMEKREFMRLSPGSRHINHSLDGEIQHGNCEESREEGSEEGPGEEGRPRRLRRRRRRPRRLRRRPLRPRRRRLRRRLRRRRLPAKKRTPNAAFMKAMTPSAALAAIIGDKPMPRTEVTKKVWDYIKKNNLQDTGQAHDDQRRRQAEGNLQARPRCRCSR